MAVNNGGIQFVSPVSPSITSNVGNDNAVRKDVFENTIGDKVNQHIAEVPHVSLEDKAKWDSALDKPTDIGTAQDDVFGKVSYNEYGLITGVSQEGITDLYPKEIEIESISGLQNLLEQLIPADADHGFIIDIIPNESDYSVGEFTDEGMKLNYRKIDTVGAESTVYITIPKASESSIGIMTKELFSVIKLISDKIDAVNGKLTILPSYDFTKSDLTEEDFTAYLEHLKTLGVEIELKDGLTVYNLHDNTSWVYDAEQSKWIQDVDAQLKIATNEQPGLFKTNSQNEFGITIDTDGKITQSNLTEIDNMLSALVDTPLIGTGDDNHHALYAREDDQTIAPAKDGETKITLESIVKDNPSITAKHLISLGVNEENMPIITDSSLTTEGVDVPILKPIYVNASNINTELRKNITTTNKYYTRYICYHGCKYGMVNVYIASNNSVVVTGILSNKDRSYTFAYNSSYMTKPEIVPINVVASNKDNDNLSIMPTEAGYDINKCIAFFVLKNGVKLGLLTDEDIKEYACNDKAEDELMDLRGYRFKKNEITAFFFSTDFKSKTIPEKFLMNVKTLQNRIIIPETVTSIGDDFLTNSGVVSLRFLNETFVIPATTNFCNACDDLQEIIAPNAAYANIKSNGVNEKFLYGSKQSISWERGITLRYASTTSEETEDGETITKEIIQDIPLDDVISIVEKVPNNDNRKINVDNNLVLYVTDIGEINVKGDDVPLLCSVTDSASEITINGITFAKSAVTAIKFGTNWDLTSIPDDFLRNFNNVATIGEIPYMVTTIGDRFLYGCTSFNEDMILHDGITSLGDSFLDDCTTFNSKLILPESLRTIGTDFMSSCTSFVKSLTIPKSVTTIDQAFMFSCYNFTGPLYVQPNFISAINPTMSLASDTSESNMYSEGINILGLSEVDLSSLLAKLPNNDTIDPATDVYYRNLVTDIYQLKLILEDDSEIIIKSDEDLALCCTNTDETTSISITVGEEVKTFTKAQVVKVEFGSGWSNPTIPVNFLMYFTNLTSLNELPVGINTIGMNFLNNCTSFNDEIIIPDSVTIIDNGFMTNCSSFNSKLVLSNKLTKIGDSFLGLATSFNQNLSIPETVTSIGTTFLWDCYDFTSYLFVSKSFINAINPMNSMLSTKEDAAMYIEGITIVGLTKAEMEQLLVKVPNISDVDSYRKINSVFNDGEFEIILISNDNEVIKLSRDNEEHMNMIANHYATPDDIIINNIKRKDITKVLFSDWEDVIPELQFIPEKFLFNFSKLNSLDKIPDVIYDIKPLAFYGCNELIEIELPNNIHLDGTSFAYNCNKLNRIAGSDDAFELPQYREIDDIRLLANDTPYAERYETGINFGFKIAPALKDLYPASESFPYRKYAKAALNVITTGGNYGLIQDEVSKICNLSAATDTIYLDSGESFVANTITAVEFLPGWSIRYIPDGFLKSCTLLNIFPTIPAKITSIGSDFMRGCTSFNTEVIIPDTILSIGENFLAECTTFNSQVTIPVSISTIPNGFLKNATPYNQIISLHNGISSIGNDFLSGTAFNQELTLPTGLRSIGSHFLANCNTFNKSIDLSVCVISSIASHFLYGCSAFNQAFNIPNTVKIIGDYFLGGCIAFAQSIIIPNTVTSIGIGFMNQCNMFNMLNVTSAFVDAIAADNSVLSSTLSSSKLYNPGVYVFGLIKSEFEELTAKLPNLTSNPYRKIVSPEAGSMVTYHMADETAAYALNQADLLSTCTEGESTEELTVNGTTFTKDQVVKVTFGTAYNLNNIPDNFCNNFINLTEISASSGNIPTSVKTIGTNFMCGCEKYENSFTVPTSITASNGSIKAGFLHNCVKFTTLNVSSNFVNAITNLDYLTLSVDENHVGGGDTGLPQAPIYNPGITITGLTSSEFNSLLSTTKLPNMNGEEH